MYLPSKYLYGTEIFSFHGRESGQACLLIKVNWSNGRMHFRFRIRGLCMEVFKGYFKLTIDVIPIALQIYTICNQLSTGPMVNLLQNISPKKDWCPDSPLNKSSVSWSLGRNFLYLLFLLTNISVRMVSEKPFVNVQLGKSILSHSISLSLALFCSFVLSLSFFFFNTLHFSLPAQIPIKFFFFFALRTWQELKGWEYTQQMHAKHGI